jgi:hypothetical protein
MKKDIDVLYKYIVSEREKLRPALLERNGINSLANEQKEKLARLMARKDELLLVSL